MAKATSKTEQVTTVTLELTDDEALALRALVGNLSVGPRSDFNSDSLYSALSDLDIKGGYFVFDHKGDYTGPLTLIKVS